MYFLLNNKFISNNNKIQKPKFNKELFGAYTKKDIIKIKNNHFMPTQDDCFSAIKKDPLNIMQFFQNTSDDAKLLFFVYTKKDYDQIVYPESIIAEDGVYNFLVVSILNEFIDQINFMLTIDNSKSNIKINSFENYEKRFMYFDLFDFINNDSNSGIKDITFYKNSVSKSNLIKNPSFFYCNDYEMTIAIKYCTNENDNYSIRYFFINKFDSKTISISLFIDSKGIYNKNNDDYVIFEKNFYGENKNINSIIRDNLKIEINNIIRSNEIYIRQTRINYLDNDSRVVKLFYIDENDNCYFKEILIIHSTYRDYVQSLICKNRYLKLVGMSKYENMISLHNDDDEIKGYVEIEKESIIFDFHSPTILTEIDINTTNPIDDFEIHFSNDKRKWDRYIKISQNNNYYFVDELWNVLLALKINSFETFDSVSTVIYKKYVSTLEINQYEIKKSLFDYIDQYIEQNMVLYIYVHKNGKTSLLKKINKNISNTNIAPLNNNEISQTVKYSVVAKIV